MINYVMALLMLTIGNSQYLSIRVSQNALQTCKRLNKLISLLIFKSDRFGRLIRELRALPMATTPGGENNLLSAIFFRILYVPHSKMFNFQTCNYL